MKDQDLKALERRREEIFQALARVGDMRRGSVVAQYLKISVRGKAHPVRCGPYYLFSCKVQGKTRSRRVRGAEMEKLRQEVDNYHRYQQLNRELIEVSEKICALRPVRGEAEGKKNFRGRSSKRVVKRSGAS